MPRWPHGSDSLVEGCFGGGFLSGSHPELADDVQQSVDDRVTQDEVEKPPYVYVNACLLCSIKNPIAKSETMIMIWRAKDSKKYTCVLRAGLPSVRIATSKPITLALLGARQNPIAPTTTTYS